MKQIYSDTPVHIFIREFVESDKGKVKDISEEYFTIKLPSTLKPIKYTYKPAIAPHRSHLLIFQSVANSKFMKPIYYIYKIWQRAFSHSSTCQSDASKSKIYALKTYHQSTVRAQTAKNRSGWPSKINLMPYCLVMV